MSSARAAPRRRVSGPARAPGARDPSRRLHGPAGHGPPRRGYAAALSAKCVPFPPPHRGSVDEEELVQAPTWAARRAPPLAPPRAAGRRSFGGTLATLLLYHSPGPAALEPLRSIPPVGGAGHPGPTGPGGLQAIDHPDALYLPSTTKLAITAPDGTTIHSLSDGTETANIGPQGGALPGPCPTPGPRGPGRRTRSRPPRGSSISSDNTETIRLATPAVTFGFEREPAGGYTCPVWSRDKEDHPVLR
jgi:hypothetical protein